eukprot:8009810-Pyramimonas_sp.AAC.1
MDWARAIWRTMLGASYRHAKPPPPDPQARAILYQGSTTAGPTIAASVKKDEWRDIWRTRLTYRKMVFAP